jgi:hypothetical protein
MDVPFSTGCAATCDVTRTIAAGSEENAKATRPGDPVREATMKSGVDRGRRRSPELARRQASHPGAFATASSLSSFSHQPLSAPS